MASWGALWRQTGTWERNLASLSTRVPADWGGGWEPARRAVREAGRRLERGLAGSDAAAARAGARALVGLGEGSTPAGDDYLVGAVLALWALDHPWRFAATRLARILGHRTSVLSASWLAAAAEGKASPPWQRLLASLAASDEEELERAVDGVLSRGQSSGSTSLAGFCRCVEALTEALS